MDAKREIRNLECQLAFREASTEASEKGILGTICGRAICFNSESQVLDEYGQTFREVIAPEAATMDFLNTQDIKINMLHMRELTFGRAKRGVSGNARLSVDNEGVNFEVDVPNCDLGIRARELTKAGVYDGCSFTALTLGMDPAYLQTSLHARELYDQTPGGIAEKKAEEEARQREEQEKKAAIEREMDRRLEALKRIESPTF